MIINDYNCKRHSQLCNSNDLLFIKMYRSAEKSGFLNHMTFIQNGVDQERRTAQMIIDGGNNGGSFVKLGGDEEEIINKRKIKMKLAKLKLDKYLLLYKSS